MNLRPAVDVVLRGGRLIDPATGRDESCDFRIVNGQIENIGSNVPSSPASVAVDLRGKLVVPGLMDMHVHLREPGYEHKETIETGCMAAAYGGFTGVCCMPNTNPAIDDESVARYVRETGRGVLHGIVDVYPIAAATKGRNGVELAPMAELVDAGAVGFSDDGGPISNAEIMRRAFEYSSMFGTPIIQHAEETTLTKGGVMNEGHTATRLGMPGIPPIAELLMVSRDLTLLRYVKGSRYHVAHVSTAAVVEEVRRGKREGLAVTCEVTPHHFTLTEEAVEGFDTNTKMHPPLRTRDDVMAMKEGLKDGTIDVIATDHAPHTIDEKEVEFSQAPFGIVGLETALGLSITELVRPGFLTLRQLIEKLCINPRRALGMPPVAVREGERAQLTLLDPNVEWVVDIQQFHSKSKNSPFHGRKLWGRAVGILNNGYLFTP